jgi:hypothetical protein
VSLLETLDAIKSSNRTPRAEFAYIDESGNTGLVTKGGTRTYTLGCVVVPLDHWTDRLDLMVEARREIRSTYRIRLRDELKANYLLRGRGPLAELGLGDGQRRDIYRRLLTATGLASSGSFAVVIDKEDARFSGDPAERAWEYLLQRLRIRSERRGHPIIVVHDDGDADRVRKHVRRFRRHSYAPGGKSVTAPMLVEDPVARDSAVSYFVQSADLVAYSAFRRFQPPSARNASVCSEQMWETLSTNWLVEVNPRRSDGIVVYPY